MDDRSESITQWWADYIYKKVNSEGLDISTELHRLIDEHKGVLYRLKDK